jgi:hypothetical protein
MEAQEHKKRDFRRFTRGFLSGGVLRRPEAPRYLKYALIVAVFMLLYIAHGYYTQNLNRQYTRLNHRVKELRTRSLSFTERRMTATRQSEIIRALREHGVELEESLTPPTVVE